MLFACSRGGAPSSVRVNEILFGGSVNERQEIMEQSVTFLPTQDAFYAHVVVTGLTGPEEIVASWWYLPTDQKIYESRVTVLPAAPVAKFFLQSGKDWPLGRYKFEVSSGGRILKEKIFEVMIEQTE